MWQQTQRQEQKNLIGDFGELSKLESKMRYQGIDVDDELGTNRIVTVKVVRDFYLLSRTCFERLLSKSFTGRFGANLTF